MKAFVVSRGKLVRCFGRYDTRKFAILHRRRVACFLNHAPGIGINYHNSAIQQLPNGDFLAAYYNNQQSEDDPDQTVLIMRRRAGAEDWDMPEPFPMFAPRRGTCESVV